MRTNVIDFVKDKINVELRESDIVDIHTLKRDQNKKGECIVRFSNRIARDHVFRNKRKLRETSVYISELVTKRNFKLCKIGRDLRRVGKTQSVWTTNCPTTAKLNNRIQEISDETSFIDMKYY